MSSTGKLPSYLRWQKQNTFVQNYIWIVAAVIAFLVAISLTSLGPEQKAGTAVAIYFILRYALAWVLNNQLADTIVGSLKFNLEEIERDIRMVFKDRSIQFYREEDGKGHRYDFTGRNLVMSMHPYKVPDRNGDPQPATKITFHALNSENRPFAQTITDAIDEMVAWRTGNPVE